MVSLEPLVVPLPQPLLKQWDPLPQPQLTPQPQPQPLPIQTFPKLEAKAAEAKLQLLIQPVAVMPLAQAKIQPVVVKPLAHSKNQPLEVTLQLQPQLEPVLTKP